MEAFLVCSSTVMQIQTSLRQHIHIVSCDRPALARYRDHRYQLVGHEMAYTCWMQKYAAGRAKSQPSCQVADAPPVLDDRLMQHVAEDTASAPKASQDAKVECPSRCHLWRR